MQYLGNDYTMIFFSLAKRLIILGFFDKIVPMKKWALDISNGDLGFWYANEDWVFDIASGNWAFDITNENWVLMLPMKIGL